MLIPLFHLTIEFVSWGLQTTPCAVQLTNQQILYKHDYQNPWMRNLQIPVHDFIRQA